MTDHEPTSASAQETITRAHRELEYLAEASADAFATVRNHRFQRMIEHHVRNQHNTAYAGLWRSHGLDPEHDLPADLAGVERLPLVDREFLREAGYAVRPAVPHSSVADRVRTSGTTTGEPLRFPMSFATRRRIYPELLIRSFALIGAGEALLDHSYHIAHFSSDGAKTGTEILFPETQRVLGERVVVGSTRAPLAEHLRVLDDHRPRYSCTSPHVYLNLLAQAHERGIDLGDCSLEYFLGGGAPLLGDDYRRLMDGLGLRRAAMTYVSNETGLMGVQRFDGGPYVLFDDDYLIEVLDDRGNHVAPGERGQIAVTSFATDAFPLIRYLIGDAATYLGQDDEFPNATAIVKIVRTVGAIIGDAKISYEEIGRMPYEMTLRGVPALAVQLARRKNADGRDHLIMRVESPLQDTERVTAVALEALRVNHHLEEALFGDDERALLPPPLIEIYRPGELAAGQFKLRAFVDESHLAAVDHPFKKSA
jgi:phenylacetate-coenzyme A ligase PaaK-like adenylate-forming protein